MDPENTGILQRALQEWNFIPDCRIDSGGSCRVWRGVYRENRTAFFKWHPQERGWAQEEAALRQWLPRISETLAGRPELIATDPDHRLLLLSALPGEIVASLSLPLETRLAVHRQAGAFIAALHSLDIADDDPIPLSCALPERLSSWLARSRGSVPPDLEQTAIEVVGDGSLFADDRRVPCHNDFQERNWLREGDTFSVIDFEHAHLNHPAFDWVRLHFGCWQDLPLLRDAFVDGHGDEPTWLRDGRLDGIGAIFAVGSIVWGSERGEQPLVNQGLAILEDLRGRY